MVEPRELDKALANFRKAIAWDADIRASPAAGASTPGTITGSSAQKSSKHDNPGKAPWTPPL
jgi:hypothetical protein